METSDFIKYKLQYGEVQRNLCIWQFHTFLSKKTKKEKTKSTVGGQVTNATNAVNHNKNCGKS